MKSKKVMALILAATMAVGSSVTVFADDANSANSVGTSFDHVDKDIIDVTLPTDTAVATVFNYFVDPEGAIKGAGKLLDGTTVTGNDDGVYFANAAGGYSSSSDEVKFEGKNSVDVDVTVAATVTATDADKDIKLVADQDALDAATGPALLMTLKVGSDAKAITSEGTTAKATIAGVADNFVVKPNDDANNFVFALKETADLTDWNSTAVQLVGKTNTKDIPNGDGAMTVPKIALTWTVAKSDAAAHGNWSGNTLWLGKDANTGFSTTGLTVEVSDGGITYQTLAADKYSIGDTGWIGATWDDIVAGIGSELTGNIFVRITDGTTRYVFENK